MSQPKTTEDRIKTLETNIFNHFDLEPIERNVKVRHCHCSIHTLSFKAKIDQGNSPIVLIHGFASAVAYWVPNIEELSQEHDVHCFDIPGFGLSDRPDFSSDETIAELEMVSCFEDWRREMKLERMYIIAHSFGAFFAASYALEHPNRVIHLILLEAWGFNEKPNLTTKQVEPQGYMQAMGRITPYFSPFFLLRCAGPFAPRLMAAVRPDMREKYHKEGKKWNDDFYKYIALCNSRYPSGEYIYMNLIFHNGFAKRPMCKRFCGMDDDIKTTFIYGSKSFIDSRPALEIQNQRNDVGVRLLSRGGHSVNVDVRDDFNKLVIQLLSANDDSSIHESESSI